MGRLTRYLNQISVYWAPLGNDRFGQPSWDEPIEIACRWEDIAEEFIDKEGSKQLSRSKVIVEQVLETEGYLWLSSQLKGATAGAAIAELPDSTNPTAIETAYPIRSFSSIPDRRAISFYREAKL